MLFILFSHEEFIKEMDREINPWSLNSFAGNQTFSWSMQSTPLWSLCGNNCGLYDTVGLWTSVKNQ